MRDLLAATQYNGGSRNAAGGADVVMAAGFAVSGIHGVTQAWRCWSAKQELEARPLRPAPPVLTPPSPVAPVQAPGGSR